MKKKVRGGSLSFLLTGRKDGFLGKVVNSVEETVLNAAVIFFIMEHQTLPIKTSFLVVGEPSSDLAT